MTPENVLKANLAEIGEEISHELGFKMVKDYQDANENDVIGYQIGSNIISKILNQPSCVGIRFYNAIDELGRKTLVYVGVNENNENIYEYSVVNTEGSISTENGIVADRTFIPGMEEPAWEWWNK